VTHTNPNDMYEDGRVELLRLTVSPCRPFTIPDVLVVPARFFPLALSARASNNPSARHS